jgi:hypothetical protein
MILCSSLNIICVSQIKDDRGGKLVAYTRRREIHKAYWLENLKEGDNLEDLATDRRIILKLIFQI